jgi:hypothetical protein
MLFINDCVFDVNGYFDGVRGKSGFRANTQFEGPSVRARRSNPTGEASRRRWIASPRSQ